MKIITVRQVDWRVFIANFFAVVIPLYFIVSSASDIQNITVQTFFIIFLLSAVGGLNFLLVKKGSFLIDIITYNDKIEIVKKDKIIYSSLYKDIVNYNLYHFINKNGGYVLRIKNDINSFCALLTWIDFSKISEKDKINYKFLEEKLLSKIGERKRMKEQDYILKFFSATTYIMLALSLLFLAGIFIYLIFYI